MLNLLAEKNSGQLSSLFFKETLFNLTQTFLHTPAYSQLTRYIVKYLLLLIYLPKLTVGCSRSNRPVRGRAAGGEL